MRSTSQRFGATSEPRAEDFRHVLSSRSLQTHLFYAGEQSVGLHPQKFRGSINPFDFPAGLLQDSKNVIALTAPYFLIRLGISLRTGQLSENTRTQTSNPTASMMKSKKARTLAGGRFLEGCSAYSGNNSSVQSGKRFTRIPLANIDSAPSSNI
jgi:hypothetical protein